MTLLSLTIAPLIALQGAGESAVAIKNDTPETWTVEYPRIVSPFVNDYRRCLNSANRKVTGVADFEMQHREDIVRCEAAALEAREASNRILANRDESGEFGPRDIEQVFDHIGRIHIARGADLDNQFSIVLIEGQKRRDDYKKERAKGLVMELRDASVVKSAAEVAGKQTEGAGE